MGYSVVRKEYGRWRQDSHCSYDRRGPGIRNTKAGESKGIHGVVALFSPQRSRRLLKTKDPDVETTKHGDASC